jgi:hypothetical protein
MVLLLALYLQQHWSSVLLLLVGTQPPGSPLVLLLLAW